MALKLITTLTVLILLSFAYKVWEKARVPPTISEEEVWKAKTINFAYKVVRNLWKFSPMFGQSVTMIMEGLCSNLINLVHSGWPTVTNDSFVEVRDTMFYSVPVRIYSPIIKKEARLKTPIVYMHGGSWRYSSADYSDSIVRTLARELGTTVVSVNYRSTSDTAFPGQFKDCLDAVSYVLNRPQELDVDSFQVIVAGDGSGATLAAAVALKLGREIKLQVLLYPVLQALNFLTPSYRENSRYLPDMISQTLSIEEWQLYGNFTNGNDSKGDTIVKTFKRNGHLSYALRQSEYAHFVQSLGVVQFRPQEHSSPTRAPVLNNGKGHSNDGSLTNMENKLINPYFAPLMSNDFSGVGNAYIVTSQFDPIRDDGAMYCNRLKMSGKVNSIKHKHYTNGFHSFMSFHSGPLAMRSAQTAMNDLIRHLHWVV